MIPFGRYKDVPLPEVPASYLVWLIGNAKLSSGLDAAVRAELDRRGVKTPPPRPRQRRACSKHPDAGIKATWLLMRDGRKAIRGECSRCGHWLGALPMTAENIALANQHSDPTAVLSFLMRLEEQGIQVKKVGEFLEFDPPLTPELRALERQCRGLLVSMLIEENATP